MNKNNYFLNYKKIASFALLLFFAFTIIGFSAQAQDTIIVNDSKYETGNYDLNDFILLAIRVANIIWAVSGSLALLAFVVGGVMMLVSAGNREWVERGRKTLTGAVIGLIIVFASYTIVMFIVKNVLGITGVENPFDTKQWQDYLNSRSG